MSDLSIRRISVCEHAERAARLFVETGERPEHHYEGPDAAAFNSAFQRYVSELAMGEPVEGSA